MENENVEMNAKTGFQVGAMVAIRLTDNLSLRPALQYTRKGYKAVLGSPNAPSYWYRNASFNFLELPLDAVYDFNVGKRTKIFIGAGPVLSAALSGKLHGIISGTNSYGLPFYEETTDDKVFKDKGSKKMDLGLDFLTGVQFGKILVTANYNHGLINMLNHDEGVLLLKNRSFAFTVGYFLGDFHL